MFCYINACALYSMSDYGIPLTPECRAPMTPELVVLLTPKHGVPLTPKHVAPLTPGYGAENKCNYTIIGA